MEFTAKAISDILKGEVVGDPEVVVNDFSKIDEGKNGTIQIDFEGEVYEIRPAHFQLLSIYIHRFILLS